MSQSSYFEVRSWPRSIFQVALRSASRFHGTIGSCSKDTAPSSDSRRVVRRVEEEMVEVVVCGGRHGEVVDPFFGGRDMKAIPAHWRRVRVGYSYLPPSVSFGTPSQQTKQTDPSSFEKPSSRVIKPGPRC